MMVVIKAVVIVCILCTLLHGFHAGKIASSKKQKLASKKRPSTDTSRPEIPNAEERTTARTQEKPKPNVIFIFADDLGFADVGYNGKQYGSGVLTPNIDRLAYKGVILDNYYVQPICTPTRSQLMTGRYQIHTGLQHSNIPPTRPFCLPLDEVTLPQKLKESGYATHMIGKWHLGFKSEDCLPTNRGFDSFLGMYLGSGDYYTHVRAWNGLAGFDFHRDTKYNQTIGYEYYGEYSTHVFARRARGVIKSHTSKYGKNNKPLFMYLSFQAPHGPLQVPSHYEHPFRSAVKGERRTLAGMIYAMDEAIGEVVDELKRTGIYDNTVIIFSSDNGGPSDIPASNWPLRGSKGTYWEGGIRAVGFVHSPLIPKPVRRTVSNAFMHVSDWFPTIVKGIAGGTLEGTKPLDGYDMWPTITSGGPSPRTELLININPVFRKLDVSNGDGHELFDAGIRACLRVGDWKILTGDQWSPKKPELSGISKWTAPPESRYKDIFHQDPKGKHIWLFNISADPYEYHDVSDANQKVVKKMLARLKYYADNMATPIWPKMDKMYSPADYGDVWLPWNPTEIITYEQLQGIKQANLEREEAKKQRKESNKKKKENAKKKKKDNAKKKPKDNAKKKPKDNAKKKPKDNAKKKSTKNEQDDGNIPQKSKHKRHELKSRLDSILGVLNDKSVLKKRIGKRKRRNNRNRKTEQTQIEEV